MMCHGRPCGISRGLSLMRCDKALGGCGKQQGPTCSGRYPERGGAQGSSGTVGGKVDAAGGVWEAGPGVRGEAVAWDAGPGRRAGLDSRLGAGVWLPSIPAQDESPGRCRVAAEGGGQGARLAGRAGDLPGAIAVGRWDMRQEGPGEGGRDPRAPRVASPWLPSRPPPALGCPSAPPSSPGHSRCSSLGHSLRPSMSSRPASASGVPSALKSALSTVALHF